MEVTGNAAGPATWTDPSPKPGAERKSPVGIRKEMLAILKNGGEEGVLWQAFGPLNWNPPFNKDKLSRAMGYLTNETGLTLQYLCNQSGEPFRWRIKP